MTLAKEILNPVFLMLYCLEIKAVESVKHAFSKHTIATKLKDSAKRLIGIHFNNSFNLEIKIN